MFLGQYSHTIDSKNRLTIPARYRAALASGAAIVQGFECNLLVYTTETFQKLASRVSMHSTTNKEVRAMRRVLFGRASEVSLDSTGRILIPTFLQEYAELDTEVTIVGSGDYFEIWSKEGWVKELVSITDPEANAERFTAFDLSTG
ncbi:MAG: division/cell wall cluster transcriptional repressor MraZ [Chloroflexi bacterium RBG_16_48_8]|nr:MAG: division/cell wall cluster transcriptional repressor MraZ [Chloroflexi bacterium RBG_16_48_8]